MPQTFEIWFVPTEKGQQTFGWKEEVAYSGLSEAAADDLLNELRFGRAPDEAQYCAYQARPARNGQ